MAPRTVKLGPLNRVEGDIEFRLVVDRGRVVRLDTMSVMFRGWEIILRGKDPWLPVSVTPRACGICGIAHCLAAVRALEAAAGYGPGGQPLPPGVLLVRNIICATESQMSGIRHHWLLFGPDLIHPRYRHWPLYDELLARFKPLTGPSYRAAVAWSRRCVEITALFAGRQPHPTAVVPGGLLITPTLADVTRALATLHDIREHFIEGVVLRGSLEEYLEVKSLRDLEAWLDRGEHAWGDLGLFIRQARDCGLDRIGRGVNRYLSYPAYEYPAGVFWIPGGLYEGAWTHGTPRYDPPGELTAFQARVSEDITYARYQGAGALHPWEEDTVPLETDWEGQRKYSWAKAPRFDGRTAEVGPLARLLCRGDPLIRDMEARLGPSVFLRQFARLHEIIHITAQVETWLRALDVGDTFLVDIPRQVPDGRFWGPNEAHRGALGHWVVYQDNRVANYQIVSPTTWNTGPRDGQRQPGPLEAAALDCPATDLDNPLEILHTLRSFDPCLVCTVHVVRADGAPLGQFRVGGP